VIELEPHAGQRRGGLRHEPEQRLRVLTLRARNHAQVPLRARDKRGAHEEPQRLHGADVHGGVVEPVAHDEVNDDARRRVALGETPLDALVKQECLPHAAIVEQRRGVARGALESDRHGRHRAGVRRRGVHGRGQVGGLFGEELHLASAHVNGTDNDGTRGDARAGEDALVEQRAHGGRVHQGGLVDEGVDGARGPVRVHARRVHSLNKVDHVRSKGLLVAQVVGRHERGADGTGGDAGDHVPAHILSGELLDDHVQEANLVRDLVATAGEGKNAACGAVSKSRG